MSEELKREIAELKRRLGELEAKAEPKPEFKPRAPMPKIDWTEGMKMHPSAAKDMARVVGDVKGPAMSAEQVENAWAKTKMYGPSGFGPPKEGWKKAEEEARRKDREAVARRRAEASEKETSAFEAWRKNTGWGNKP